MLIARRLFFVAFGLSVASWPAPTHAQQTGEVNLTAASANVKESGSPVKMRILRWSTDEERNAFVAALSPPPPAPAGAAGEGRGAGRGGAGRGAGAAAGGAAAGGAAAGGAAAGGRGGAARGGRGDAPAAPVDPIVAFTAAIGKAPLVGYLWTNDVTGYSIKYAYRAALPDGSERIILATDRRLGAHTTAWGPLGAEASAKAAVGATPLDYEFTLIEMRLDPKGMGEGKASLTTKVIVDDVDNGAKTVALDNYAATPAILRNVKR